jgi:hypothetical protein
MEEIPGTSVGVLAAEGRLSQEERNEVSAASTFIPCLLLFCLKNPPPLTE